MHVCEKREVDRPWCMKPLLQSPTPSVTASSRVEQSPWETKMRDTHSRSVTIPVATAHTRRAAAPEAEASLSICWTEDGDEWMRVWMHFGSDWISTIDIDFTCKRSQSTSLLAGTTDLKVLRWWSLSLKEHKHKEIKEKASTTCIFTVYSCSEVRRACGLFLVNGISTQCLACSWASVRLHKQPLWTNPLGVQTHAKQATPQRTCGRQRDSTGASWSRQMNGLFDNPTSSSSVVSKTWSVSGEERPQSKKGAASRRCSLICDCPPPGGRRHPEHQIPVAFQRLIWDDLHPFHHRYCVTKPATLCLSMKLKKAEARFVIMYVSLKSIHPSLQLYN